jgi:hypothetical protein
MYGSQKVNKDIVLSLYKDERTVFRFIDVAMLVEETSMLSLSKKLNYYVSKGQLQNPRKGIYTKQNYNPEELACCLYSPSYISLDYVLQKKGILFQYNTQITMSSYLSRIVEIEGQSYRFRKIKDNILLDPLGINRLNSINIAGPERAFLDMLYLEPDYHFDNIHPLDKSLIKKLLPIYQSKALIKRFDKLFRNG